MLRRNDHVRRSEKRITAGRIDAKLFFGRLAGDVCDGEIDFCATALANPVPLHVLDALRPVEFVEAFEQAFPVKRDAHQPLFQVSAFNFFRSAFFMGAVGENFFVCTDNLAMFAPPDLRIGVVGETLGIAILADRILALGFDFCGNRKFRNRASLLERLVEPCVVQPDENPLRPLVILGIGRVDFLVPVIGKPEPFNLPAEIVAVLLRRNARMRSRLDGVLLGWKSERVPTHRMQNVKSLGALVTTNDVRRRVAFRMAYVKTRSRRIGEHVQAIILGLCHVCSGLESLLRIPIGLPLGFDLLRIVFRHFRLRIESFFQKPNLKKSDLSEFQERLFFLDSRIFCSRIRAVGCFR